MRIAIIGSGISGLTCAYLLSRSHEVVLFEKEPRMGGHTDTRTVSTASGDIDVDTGFIVYNERTYPLFCRLISELGIETQESDMSFGARDESCALEWRATSVRTIFAQRRNLFRVRFWLMLVDIVRFNRRARGVLEALPSAEVTLGEFLRRGHWSTGFQNWYLIPLGSSIWSADPETFAEIPLATFLRFFDRHGWLRFRDQPRWRTITGGSKRYVESMLRAPDRSFSTRTGEPVIAISRHPGCVDVQTSRSTERFDQVIIAAHSDEALAMLADPSDAEREVLGSIRYQLNRATLHCDISMMPIRRPVWASWNYHRCATTPSATTLTYWLNNLQNIDVSDPVLLTLNREGDIDETKVFEHLEYSHPVFDAPAVRAQLRRSEISGVSNTWYCGAYWGFGFHEDGVRSAVEVCEQFGVSL